MEKVVPKNIFTKDKAVLSLLAFNAITTAATVITSFILLRSHDFKVPVQYVVNDGSVLQTSSWYTLFSLPAFAIISTVAVIFLANKLYKADRIFSIGILIAYSLVSTVGLLVTFALLNLVSKV